MGLYLLIGDNGNVGLQIRVFSALLVPGLFSGSVTGSSAGCCEDGDIQPSRPRMGTSSHPGQLTQPREVAQLCQPELDNHPQGIRASPQPNFRKTQRTSRQESFTPAPGW